MPRTAVLLDTDSEPEEADNNTTISRTRLGPCHLAHEDMQMQRMRPLLHRIWQENPKWRLHMFQQLQPYYNSPQLPNRKHKIAGLLPTEEMCILLLISHLLLLLSCY